MITFKPVIRAKQHRLENMPFEALLDAQEHLCFYCNKHMAQSARSRDHLFPKSHGFSLQGNLVIAHISCNNKKADRYPTMEEIIKWVNLYTTKRKGKLLVAIRNKKPRFIMRMTAQDIEEHCW